MTTGPSSTAANAMLSTLLGTYTWVKLHVGDPGGAGTANPAADTTREQATWSTPAGGTSHNTGVMNWPAEAAAEDPTHFSAWDASTAGNFGFSGTVTSAALSIGDILTVAASGLVVSIPLAA